MFIKEYILQNWALILILSAFLVSLKMTVFLEKTMITRLYKLIAGIFLLSIAVFTEFYLAGLGQCRNLRIILIAIRYSATPFIIAQIIFTLVRKQRWFVFIPAIVLAVINCISVFTGFVFSVDNGNVFRRGPLGFLPFIMVGFYSVLLIGVLLKNSSRQKTETIPIIFMGFALSTGLIMPFVYGSLYSQLFCTIISIALYVYYVFLILQVTKKDPLTGLLNRQAYYADLEKDPEYIKALVSIDLNGLKKINDTYGHEAGDEALSTVSDRLIRALKSGQSGYRIGGDEFMIICRNNSLTEVTELVERIHSALSETIYNCSIGYSYSANGEKSISDLKKESDAMMYREKVKFYNNSGRDRRQR